MAAVFQGLPFGPTEILLPKEHLSAFSVIACDQHTSEPEYWQAAERLVGDTPSALRLILPEYKLHGDVTADIQMIHQTMESYVNQNVFDTFPDAMIYVERIDSVGRLRRGLVGALDLEAYEYLPGKIATVRATEETVPERIPPRAAVRRGAALETSHVMLLCDDGERTVIEPLAAQKADMRLLYDFDLMLNGGHLSGWLLGENQLAQVATALKVLQGNAPMLFAVGDGNHSLATAKALHEEQPDNLRGRYALCELVNLYDESLTFEPIHRVAFDIERGHLENAYANRFDGENPDVGDVQEFLDSFVSRFGGEVDYIHGADTALKLGERSDAMTFLMDTIPKENLFSQVTRRGVLPRKAFSMGHADDKRFYLECRKI